MTPAVWATLTPDEAEAMRTLGTLGTPAERAAFADGYARGVAEAPPPVDPLTEAARRVAAERARLSGVDSDGVTLADLALLGALTAASATFYTLAGIGAYTVGRMVGWLPW